MKYVLQQMAMPVLFYFKLTYKLTKYNQNRWAKWPNLLIVKIEITTKQWFWKSK